MAHALHILDPDRFQDVQSVGAGNHATVFSAWDSELERRVAIKVSTQDMLLDMFGSERLSELGIADGLQELVNELGAAAGQRYTLLREAKLLAKIDHPHVVPILEVGLLDGAPAVVMPLLDGGNLDERGCEGKWDGDWREVLRVAIEIGTGLQAIHAAGVLHRDFKPNNVLFDSRGRALVVDLGLACQMRDEAAMADWPGTRDYMAPETRAQSFRDERDDIYAYCTVVFQMLYGHMPFASRDARVHGRVSRIERPGGVPARVHEILTRGLAPAAANRWPDMSTLLEQLRRVEATSDKRPRRWTWFASGAAAAAVFGAIVSSSVVRADACDAVGSELDLLWNEQVEAEVIGGVGVGAVTSLGEWTTRYLSARKVECERAQTQALPTGPSACMLTMQQVFSTTVTTLRSPAMRRGLDVPAALRELPRPERCLEPAADLASVSTGLFELNEIDTKVSTLVRLGALSEAKREIAKLRSSAREQNASYVMARGTYWAGHIARLEGELGVAKEQLYLAYERAGAIGDRFLLADVALELTAIAASEQNPAEANAYARVASPVFAAQHPGRLADLLEHQARALLGGGEDERAHALELLHEALEYRADDIRDFGGSRESRAHTQLELARALLANRRHEDALQEARRSLDNFSAHAAERSSTAQLLELHHLIVQAKLRLGRHAEASESVSELFEIVFETETEALLERELAWLDGIYTREFTQLDPRVLGALREYRARRETLAGGGRSDDLPAPR